MSRPLVTIAIPTYNRADSYLLDAIEAALGQTYENIEVLVGDNCSTDGTQQLVENITDPRLRYFRHEKNIGARNNMNFLLANARGKYFLLYADDDQIDRDLLGSCIDAVGENASPGLILSGSRVIDENGQVLRAKESVCASGSVEELILLWYHQKIHLFLCSTLFNSQILRDVGGLETEYGHFNDVAAEFKCAARGGFVSIPQVKAGLRTHASSITRLAGVAEWADNSLSLLNLAMSLGHGRRDEIDFVGRRISARRNYTLADDVPSLAGRWKAYFTILRKFHFRYWPETEAMKSLAVTTLRAPFTAIRQPATN